MFVLLTIAEMRGQRAENKSSHCGRQEDREKGDTGRDQRKRTPPKAYLTQPCLSTYLYPYPNIDTVRD